MTIASEIRWTPSRRLFLLSMGTVALQGCAGNMTFPVSDAAQSSLSERGINIVRVTAENVSKYSGGRWLQTGVGSSNPPPDTNSYSYRVGVGDQLRIQAWNSPERRSEGSVAAAQEGPVVNENGQFFYPYVGMMDARGKTVTEIRSSLETALRTYISEPQIEVEVQNFVAHRVTLVGEVGQPGSVTLTNVPLRLLDLINQAGNTTKSDLRRVEIRRSGRDYSVNLRAFVEAGAPGQNPILLPGDLVVVPAVSDNKVFVFGEIGAGEIELDAGGLSLTEVLAAKGGLDRARANARGIFVFRRQADQVSGFDVFQFDLSDASTLIMTSQFSMAPLDVVFVTTDPIARWNDTVGRLISPVSGVIQAKAVADEL